MPEESCVPLAAKIHGPVSGRGENQLNTGWNTGLYPDVIAHILETTARFSVLGCVS